MPMFPDSGVPPADARNSLPDVNTTGCDELWYSTSRCQPRFDPAAANAMLAEQMNLIMKAELQYDCGSLTHIERAVNYINQRGLPQGAILWDGPFDYRANLDPRVTRYNDYLVLTVIPAITNQGVMRINVDGLGLVYVRRNDYQMVESGDFRAGIPHRICYWNGNFFHLGLLPSQVPLIVKGGVDIWIRTDGNDTTGDGSANEASKAFRTIQGAWGRVGARYAATPLFVMNLKLGIPGTYAGAIIGPFGGGVTLSSVDPADRLNYKLSSIDFGNNSKGNLFFRGLAQCVVTGITFQRDVAQPFEGSITRLDNSNVIFDRCNWDSTVANQYSTFIHCFAGSIGSTTEGSYEFNGRGLALGSIVACYGGQWNGSIHINGADFWYVDTNANAASMLLRELAVMSFGKTRNHNMNTTGKMYDVTGNSVLSAWGQTMPGSIVGSSGSGGQYIP